MNEERIHYVGPRQIVLVTSRFKDEDNIINIGWNTRVSTRPELYAIAVSKHRYSYNMIKKGKCFVVNFMDVKDEGIARYCGKESKKNVDKIKDLKLIKIESENIDCFRIRKSLAYFECKLIKEVKLQYSSYSIFIGEIVKKELIKKGNRMLWSEGNYITTEKESKKKGTKFLEGLVEKNIRRRVERRKKK